MPQLVRIDWEDVASNDHGWVHADELSSLVKAMEDGAMCSTTGWLVYEDDKCVLVAAMNDLGREAYGLCVRIPRGNIRTIHRIPREGRRKR